MFGSPETTPGGRALKFYSSVRLDIRRIESIKDGVEVVGNRTRVKVVKNKVAPPFRQAEFDIMYGKGISREGSLLDIGVDLGIVKKSGAWYTYEGEQLGQGRENAKTFLIENPEVMVEISERVRHAGRHRRDGGRGRRVHRRPTTEPITADDVPIAWSRADAVPAPGLARHPRVRRRAPGPTALLRVARAGERSSMSQDERHVLPHGAARSLALFGWDDLAADAAVTAEPLGRSAASRWPSTSRAEDEVDAAVASWVAAGGGIDEGARATVFWGGYSGYVADLDGHLLGARPQPVHPVPAGRHARPAG